MDKGSLKKHLLHYFVCVCMRVRTRGSRELHYTHVEVRGHLVGVSALLPLDPRGQTQINRLGDKGLYSLGLLLAYSHS